VFIKILRRLKKVLPPSIAFNIFFLHLFTVFLSRFGASHITIYICTVDNLQKCVTCSKWVTHSSKASIHVIESVSVVKIKKSPPNTTSVYEQDSQMQFTL